jgi:uncharacterized protein (TIGR02266 family)
MRKSLVEGPSEGALRDKRHSPRLPLQIDVEVEGQEAQIGKTSDIGRGGLFVATGRLLPVGERVRVHITLPGLGIHLGPWCEVRWIRDAATAARDGLPSGMGLEFVELAPVVRQALHSFIRQQEELSGAPAGEPST